MKIFISALVIAGLGAAAYARPDLPPGVARAFLTEPAVTDASPANDEASTYVLAKVDRGPIETAVSSSGTLAAVSTVLVSSQVSGPMLRIRADYNSEVKKGDVIGEIDPTTFENAVQLARAELAVAEANVGIQAILYDKAVSEFASQASVVEAAKAGTMRQQIAYNEARKDVERKRTLTNTGAVSAIDFSKAQAAMETALQNLKSAEANHQVKVSLSLAEQARMRSVLAQVQHARAQVDSKRASLQAAMTSLDMTRIRSPTDGVVIGRNIEEGQMVSTTIQTQQTLFTVAYDLRQMQIKISVDEADIGKIREGQLVSFKVDAHPGREFSGRVSQVRMDAKPVQNVVTYEVVASAANPDRMLLPGMTANARIIIDSRDDITKVPVAALRFTPAGAERPATTHIWTLDEYRRPKAIPVRVGLSDRQMVEVTTPRPIGTVIVGVSHARPTPSLTRRLIGSL